ncbi:MAG TPA: hypothetical protein VFL47_09535, partial [Flavisolibacter sp.]|nr:hypothetical protein [Flavisolibacter sp.]
IDNYIKSMYDVISIKLENARYDDDDVPRYRQARGLASGNNQGDVSGYSTVLTVYKVKPKSSDGFLFPPAMFVYVDNATICPPPEVPPCD